MFIKKNSNFFLASKIVEISKSCFVTIVKKVLNQQYKFEYLKSFFYSVIRTKSFQWWRICLPTQETQESWIWSLGQEDSLEKEMATHSSIFAWNTWTEEPGGLQSMGLQRVGHDWAYTHVGLKEKSWTELKLHLKLMNIVCTN